MPNIKRKNNVRASNKQAMRKSGSVIKSVDGKLMIVGNTGEIKIRGRRNGHVVGISYSSDDARKKVAQLGCAYAKIYNREREDIDLIATGLARFKK